ncbi:MAG: ABC transporter permease [Candidatus Wallbacteria bacterium]|nr:ABC transporter permease [Candidatus Wallbacteria bacterium]MBI4867989.1 ABC transporter permease [Candidatus Wallbacteria bacterium]
MRLAESLEIALEAVARHRLRSFLTALGIIIGVFSVITIVAVGAGAQHMMQESFKSFGTNVLWLLPGSHVLGGARISITMSNSLTPEDAEAIAKECPDVIYVSPAAFTGSPVVHGNQNWSTVVNGVGQTFPVVRSWYPAQGAFFTEAEVTMAAKVCVLGRTVATKLFGRDDPVGRTVRLKKVPFRVIGVMAAKGQTGWGQDQDDIVLAPYTTVMKKLSGQTHLAAVSCTAVSASRMKQASEQITALLRRRHRIQPGAEQDFSILSAKDVLAMVDKIYDTLILFLGSVASIALLVGGIGIMNIMLVSVTERIREIGIRLAVGARGRDILLQFLLEALLLSVSGGLLGLLAGVGIAQAIASTLNWPILIDPGSSAIAVLFAAGVGLAFGFLPAWRASRLDPIQALRSE